VAGLKVGTGRGRTVPGGLNFGIPRPLGAPPNGAGGRPYGGTVESLFGGTRP
jgi:hypothetical protein